MSRAVGEITLVYNDHFVEQRKYRCIADRKRIIEGWSRKYKPQWSKCTFLINPELPTVLLIDDKGANFRQRKEKRRLDIHGFPFKKPLGTVKDPKKKTRILHRTPERFS